MKKPTNKRPTEMVEIGKGTYIERPKRSVRGEMTWISIAKRTPKEGQRVLTYFKQTGIDIMKYHDLTGTKDEICGKNFFVGGGGFLTDDVTHWMELPDPPKVKK